MNWESVWSTETVTNILSFLVLILGCAIVLFGMPAQIKKNHREKACGQPAFIVWMALALLTARIGHSILVGHLHQVPSDSLCLIFSTVILRQQFVFGGGGPTEV